VTIVGRCCLRRPSHEEHRLEASRIVKTSVRRQGKIGSHKDSNPPHIHLTLVKKLLQSDGSCAMDCTSQAHGITFGMHRTRGSHQRGQCLIYRGIEWQRTLQSFSSPAWLTRAAVWSVSPRLSDVVYPLRGPQIWPWQKSDKGL
jgi:hypothetical protein